MHLLHDYVAKQLAERLKARRVVVWYDVRNEFAAFVTEVRGGPKPPNARSPVMVAGVAADLAEYDGSMFEIRAIAEPLVCSDVPETLVIKTKGEEAALRDLARHLRTGFADADVALADRVEEELGLKNATLPAGALGAIDTFRFEERALLNHCGDLIANQRCAWTRRGRSRRTGGHGRR